MDLIISEDSPKTFSKLEIPQTPLLKHVSDIIRQFRPKCGLKTNEINQENIEKLVKKWLENTSKLIEKGLSKSLALVTSIKGLNLIREESTKAFIPKNWMEICRNAKLPNNFDVWGYFFQIYITKRAKELITKKISSILSSVQQEIDKNSHVTAAKVINNWCEDINDVSRSENNHEGLKMKTRGFNGNIVSICKNFDGNFSEILADLSVYLYGNEVTNVNFIVSIESDKKFADRTELQLHLMKQCLDFAGNLTKFLVKSLNDGKNGSVFVEKSLFYAKFLVAMTTLCESYKKCCMCNANSDIWEQICSSCANCSGDFWGNWVKNTAMMTNTLLTTTLDNFDVFNSIDILPVS